MLYSLLISLLGVGAVFIVLRIANIFYKRTLINVELVDAGIIDEHTPSPPHARSLKISPFFETFYHNGKKVNPKDYIVSKVDGDCMVPRNIYAGDLLFIEKLNGKPDPDSLSIGDIILIKYGEKPHSGYKIREYRGIDDNNCQKLQTLYYQRDGKDKRSSHELENVKGIVRMKFTI